MIQFSKPGTGKYSSREIKRIIDSGWFCLGEYTDQLSEYFKDTTGVKYAIPCANATQGLIIALRSLKFKNKLIGLPVFTWPSTLYAILCSHNSPVYIDVDPKYWIVSQKYKPIEHGLATIMPVDTFGAESIVDTNVPTVYDVAHGFNNPMLGKRGLIEVVSFSFTKTVTGGQGGIILTNNDAIYQEALELVRLSAKMQEINAYLILKSIEDYDRRDKIKLKIINKYRELIKVPFTEQKFLGKTNYSVYAILFDNAETRNNVTDLFKKNDIEVKTYYEPLVKGYPVSDDIYSRILSLPIYDEVEPEVEFICDVINKTRGVY